MCLRFLSVGSRQYVLLINLFFNLHILRTQKQNNYISLTEELTQKRENSFGKLCCARTILRKGCPSRVKSKEGHPCRPLGWDSFPIFPFMQMLYSDHIHFLYFSCFSPFHLPLYLSWVLTDTQESPSREKKGEGRTRRQKRHWKICALDIWSCPGERRSNYNHLVGLSE